MCKGAEKIYKDFTINRSQTQTLALMAISYDIEAYISEHKTDYQKFLNKNNKKKEKRSNEEC